MKKSIAALAVVVVALLLPLAPAHAGEPTRPAYARWEASVVNVYVDRSTKGHGWALARSLRAWSAGPVDLKVVSDPTRATITVREIPRSPDAAGEAHYVHLAGVMQTCAIDLTSTTQPARRAHVAAHELGHCLGLPHVSEYNSVMDVWLRGPWTTPTALDLDWLRRAYAPTA